jgi:hypothetical protein
MRPEKRAKVKEVNNAGMVEPIRHVDQHREPRSWTATDRSDREVWGGLSFYPQREEKERKSHHAGS